MGQAALSYVRQGFWVVPVHAVLGRDLCSCQRARSGCQSPGKHPRKIDRRFVATNDAAIVERLWRRWPNMNVGLAPRRSGLITIDVDRRPDGADGLAALAVRFGQPIFDTVRAATGGGGWHVYFRLSRDLNALLPRHYLGHGGLGMPRMVVVAPSLHPSLRPYAWHLGEGPEVRAPLAVPPLLEAYLRRVAAEGEFVRRTRGSWRDRLQRAGDRSRLAPVRRLFSRLDREPGS